jgi:hypothetical protein
LKWNTLVYFMAILNRYITTIWCTYIFCGHLEILWYIFPPFWYFVSRKIWQPCRRENTISNR